MPIGARLTLVSRGFLGALCACGSSSEGVASSASAVTGQPVADAEWAHALVTDPYAPLGLGGMHRCTLLTPARAVEWIPVASLKN